MKKRELNTIAEIVKAILKKYPASREDDMLLYGYVLNYYGYSVKTSVEVVCKLIRKNEIPTYTAITRSRRKVQELYPELKGSTQNQIKRATKTTEYRKLAQDNNI